MAPMSVVRVALDGDKGTEEARYPFDKRLRDIVEAPDGSLYVIEDGAGGRLLQLTPADSAKAGCIGGRANLSARLPWPTSRSPR